MWKFWNKLFGKKQKENDAPVRKQQQRVLTDDEKHSYRYFLQYKFLPELAAGVTKGEISPDYILEIGGWENFMKKHVDKDFFLEWDELRCEGIKLSENLVMALYIFPSPRQIPEAAFGAVLINLTNNNAVYYTLEYSYNGAWVLGCTTKEKHYSFGNLENPCLNSFIDWVVERAKEAEPELITTLPKGD